MNNNLNSYIMPTYGERDLEFYKGEGCNLFTRNNEIYLDFAGGIAVNSLGHCHPELIKSLKDQIDKLWHASNLYYYSEQEDYAELICKNSFADKVFFTNSGTESIECGIKIVRSYYKHHNNFIKKNIITFEGAFHGRSFGALSAQKNSKYSKPFEPLMPGFDQIPFDDKRALEQAVNDETAAILIEPIQGEGGIKPASLNFLKFVEEICKERKILFFLDEVQCGFGRSGKLFSYEWANVQPDIMAVAKGIGSGFPMGACLATDKASIGMNKGSHGSTYGGNPLAVSVGNKVLEIILRNNFLQTVQDKSNYFWKELNHLKNKHSQIIEIRGAGLLIGIKTKKKNTEISSAFKKNKLLSVPAEDNIVRLAPPLIVTEDEIKKAINIIDKTFEEIND